MTLVLPLLFGFLAQAVSAVPPAQDVGAVRALYSSAAFEEAIALLSTIEPVAMTAEHEQYRALSYLALGRPADAEAALGRLVRLAPLYILPEAEVSPRILTMFRDVRRRVLPGLVREQYVEGKRLFDEREFVDAFNVLKHVRAILNDPDLAYPADAFADLRQLADGFGRLAEIEITQTAKAAAAPPPAPIAAARPADASASSGVVVTRIVVHTPDDVDVTPPVEIARFMPPWVPPSAMARFAQEIRGELQVIVDESGRVEQARMTRPTMPGYDLSLTSATERWRFEPARRNGQAVKYLLTFQIVLLPSQRR